MKVRFCRRHEPSPPPLRTTLPRSAGGVRPSLWVVNVPQCAFIACSALPSRRCAPVSVHASVFSQPNDVWFCSRCLFSNEGLSPTCKMCGFPRPQPGAQSAGYPKEEYREMEVQSVLQPLYVGTRGPRPPGRH